MKRQFLFFVLLACTFCAAAQSEDEFLQMQQQMLRQFNEFDGQVKQDYVSFRDECNNKYCDFIRQSWGRFMSKDPVPQPIIEELPPVVIKEEEQQKPLEDNPVVIEEIIPAPPVVPQPSPVAPIEPQPAPLTFFSFPLYGCTFQLPDSPRFQLGTLSNAAIAEQWERLASSDYDNLVAQSVSLRSRLQMCDWSYLQLINSFCNHYLGEYTNEAELLKAFLLSQSGYQVRLAIGNNRLFMLYGSKHIIYDNSFYLIQGMKYYALQPLPDNLQVCQGSFPNEKPISLVVQQEQPFGGQTSHRTIASNDTPILSATVVTEGNLMKFCQSYPSSCLEGNFMTRWAFYADMPLSLTAREQLYPQLQRLIAGLDTYDAVNLLCHWIQTAFVYEYDDKVWGGDRAFFADETLHYPYCDCEDRSILLTRIVRDLLGLPCALVYYPGHLATAIAVGEEAKGDFLRLNGVKFLICDPTYINAPIGLTMPGMDNSAATVIML